MIERGEWIFMQLQVKHYVTHLNNCRERLAVHCPKPLYNAPSLPSSPHTHTNGQCQKMTRLWHECEKKNWNAVKYNCIELFLIAERQAVLLSGCVTDRLECGQNALRYPAHTVLYTRMDTIRIAEAISAGAMP